ncbi:MAG: sodium:proton antiporter [Acidobacteriota bacterium]|nr:sodium:proton antiporter [Acidobacteriota bacterium]
MTEPIIIVCALLLIAYLFDLWADRIKVPSVVLLLLLGWLTRQAVAWLGMRTPDLDALLELFGTVGLILIVLEGALELELDESKVKLVVKTFLAALLPMLALAFGFAGVMSAVGDVSFPFTLVNVVPLCVISSAIAIPTAAALSRADREFVIYESSFSDILGVLFFNFVLLNETVTFQSVGVFCSQLLVMVAISLAANVGLAFLLNKIEHHTKFVPIILMVILIYAISKIWHLPALLFILLFGLFLGNFDQLKHFRGLRMLHPERLEGEILRFKELTIEATFLVRSLFFILFGYLIETDELLDAETLPWAAAVVAGIFLLRALVMKALGMRLGPVLWLAPRGLITILLFLSIPAARRVPLVNRSLIIQVIILTALGMMAGLMVTGGAKKTPPQGDAGPARQPPCDGNSALTKTAA